MSTSDKAVQQANHDHANGKTSDTNKMTPNERDVYLAHMKKLKGE